MTPTSIDLRLGDCLDVLASLDECSVDAVVTDSPYGLEFMGKEWDGADGFRRSLNAADVGRDDVFGRTSARGPEYRSGHFFQQWCEQWASECLRILKPGGHLVNFGGTRTYHRLAAGVEDAGFEIRDQLAWMFGSGFPKSLDVSKAIDARLGAEREIVAVIPDRWAGKGQVLQRATQEERDEAYITEPATAAAAAAAGWGTALKPGYEPIVLARKPLCGTVAANVMEHGTGALNIDGCRIDFQSDDDKASATPQGTATTKAHGAAAATPDAGRGIDRIEFAVKQSDLGRWPANVCLDEEAAVMLDASVDPTRSRKGEPRSAASPGDGWGMTATGQEYDDEGGPSRFFYCGKVSSDERHQGLAVPSLFSGGDAPDRNQHPTVKPIDLMRWLCRLITPPGGLIVDPFLGSGTTGIAAALEGFRFIGIEREPDYMRIAEARISHWTNNPVEAER